VAPTATTLTPLEAVRGSSWFHAGGVPCPLQGCSVTRPGLVTADGMRELAARGVNTLRVWADYHESGDVDLDGLRAMRAWGEELGVRVLVALFSPAHLTDMYEPVSRFARGLTVFNGTCEAPRDVVRAPAALETVVDRARTVLAAFEDSPALLGWELVNQTDDLYDVASAEMAAFIRRLADRVRAEDARFGRTRLLAASSFQPVPPAWLIELEALDFVAFHAYGRSVHDPTDRIAGALNVGAAVRYAIEAAPGRPVLDVESGPIGHLYDRALPRPDVEFRGELAHNLRWAHLASGGAGTGLHIPINDEGLTAARRVQLSRLRWTPLTSELRDIEAIGRFWRLAPPEGPVRALAGALEVDSDGVLAFGSGNAGRVVGWLLRDTRESDLAADVQRALAAGPTEPGTLDLRLLALDAWKAALDRAGLDPHNQYSRAAIGRLLRQRGVGVRRACELVDEGLAHLLAVAPDMLNAAPPAPAQVEVTLGGLDDRPYRVLWVDDVTGEVLSVRDARGPAVRVASPPFDRHVALVAIASDQRAA
jgi:hypothetical protein